MHRTHSHTPDEVRPVDTAAYPAVPLLRLRRRDREPIPPDLCLLGPDCLVCRWRREGLLAPVSGTGDREGPLLAVEARWPAGPDGPPHVRDGRSTGSYRAALPGPGDQCVCGSFYACRCRPEPEPDRGYHEAYERGRGAYLADGPDAHPLACWPTDAAEAAVARDWRRLVAGRPVVGVDGRRFYGSEWFRGPGAWRLRGRYGADPFRREPCPEGYLAGFEDAMAGLPSAVGDPDRHRASAAALDAYAPLPDLYDGPVGPRPDPGPVSDWLPF